MRSAWARTTETADSSAGRVWKIWRKFSAKTRFRRVTEHVSKRRIGKQDRAVLPDGEYWNGNSFQYHQSGQLFEGLHRRLASPPVPSPLHNTIITGRFSGRHWVFEYRAHRACPSRRRRAVFPAIRRTRLLEFWTLADRVIPRSAASTSTRVARRVSQWAPGVGQGPDPACRHRCVQFCVTATAGAEKCTGSRPSANSDSIAAPVTGRDSR